jgi:hypothetical protein
MGVDKGIVVDMGGVGGSGSDAAGDAGADAVCCRSPLCGNSPVLLL